MKTILLISLLILSACGKHSNSKDYPIKSDEVARFVNDKAMPADPNLTLDKAIVNTDYPIEIALYKDGRFYYDLPRLGDGHGTWVHKNDHIELKAKRTLFDMYIEIHSADEGAHNLSIQFTDRFGPNHLEMKNVNI